MANTAKTIDAGPAHADTLKLGGGSSETVILNCGTQKVTVGAATAAGSAQTDAGALAYPHNVVSAADGTKGVVLPAGATGKVVTVYNSVATNGLKVYPPTSGTINGGSANAAVTIEGKTLALFICDDGTNWSAMFTANT